MICHTGLLTACKQDEDETAVPIWSCLQAASKPVWHISLLCVQWKTPDDGQRNCQKHVFQSKNKFEKLVHLVGFIIIRKLSWCTVTWTSTWPEKLLQCCVFYFGQGKWGVWKHWTFNNICQFGCVPCDLTRISQKADDISWPVSSYPTLLCSITMIGFCPSFSWIEVM